MKKRLELAKAKYGYTKEQFSKDCSVLNSMIDIEENYVKGTFSFSREGQNREVHPCLLYCLGSIAEENILDDKTVIFKGGLSENKITSILDESVRLMFSFVFKSRD